MLLFSQAHHLLFTILFGVLAHIMQAVFFGHYRIHNLNEPLDLRMVITMQVNPLFLLPFFYRNKILIAACRHDAIIMIEIWKRIQSQQANRIGYSFPDVCRIQRIIFFIEQVPAADSQVIVREAVGHRPPGNELCMIVVTKGQHKASAVFLFLGKASEY